jgi:hypothetical protein
MDPEKQEGASEEKPVVETADELKQRLENAKAENARKTQEIQRLREEAEARQKPADTFNPQDLTTWKDHELKAVLKDQQYVAIHDQAQELLEKRRFQRFQAEREESTLRVNAELERQKEYPETFDPAHPMSVRMNQLMRENHLDRTPAGRLVAARLAASELEKSKAVAAGRKQEQDRQADVNASYQGESRRPVPTASDKAKLEELKKKAMAGDQAAKAEWFKARGLI